MSARKPKYNENYVKPSARKQWQERSELPIAAQPMTAADIENHRQNLIRSYQCDDNEITFSFEKILDENDDDRNDCLLLTYKMLCGPRKNKIREIFVIKVPIPEGVRLRADEQRKQSGRDKPLRKPVRALPAPAPRVTVVEPSDPPKPRPKPQLPSRTTKK